MDQALAMVGGMKPPQPLPLLRRCVLRYKQYLLKQHYFFQYHNLTWILGIHQAWAIAFYWQNWAPHFHPLSGFGQQAWPSIISCSRQIARMSDQICRWILFYGIPSKMYLPNIFAEDIAFAKNQLNQYVHTTQVQLGM